MTYYAQINSQNKLISIDGSQIVSDEYNSTDVQNIEVAEEYYENWQQYGKDYYIYENNEIVLNPEYESIKLQEAKEIKIQENDIIRDNALISGVTYDGILFDSDTDQKINLLATVSMMGDTDTIEWFGMNNDSLICTKQDLIAIGGLITQLHSFVWNKNAQIKELINNAQTIEEVNAIEIDYTK